QGAHEQGMEAGKAVSRQERLALEALAPFDFQGVIQQYLHQSARFTVAVSVPELIWFSPYIRLRPGIPGPHALLRARGIPSSWFRPRLRAPSGFPRPAH